MNKYPLIFTVVLIVIILVLVFYNNSNRNTRLPSGETTLISDTSTREMFVTDGVKHSVPLDEIRGGGPPQDGIPSIDNPVFISILEALEEIDDSEPGIAYSDGNEHRFYPFNILVRHELVNDQINGKRVLISYCPLCFSGIVFDPIVDEERVEFGTSGLLWNSNLVMYDRKTESLWSQILGESILGIQTGTVLEILPSDLIRFGEWKTIHPDGEVLSRASGSYSFGTYDQDPYRGYYSDNNRLIFDPGVKDDRLETKDFILGVVINGEAKAYLPSAVKLVGEVEDVVGGEVLIVQYIEEIDTLRMYTVDGDDLKRVNPVTSFWFAWIAAHPDTKLYK